MIIYKRQDNGEATDFQPSEKCPNGWIVATNIKNIPEKEDEKRKYNTDEYNNKLALKKKETKLIKLISSNEYHLISRRFTVDREVWEQKLDKWAAQLEEVRSDTIVEIEPLPVFN